MARTVVIEGGCPGCCPPDCTPFANCKTGTLPKPGGYQLHWPGTPPCGFASVIELTIGAIPGSPCLWGISFVHGGVTWQFLFGIGSSQADLAITVNGSFAYNYVLNGVDTSGGYDCRTGDFTLLFFSGVSAFICGVPVPPTLTFTPVY